MTIGENDLIVMFTSHTRCQNKNTSKVIHTSYDMAQSLEGVLICVNKSVGRDVYGC